MKTFAQYLIEMSPEEMWLRNGGYELGKRHTPEVKDKYQGPLNELIRMAGEIGGPELQMAVRRGIKAWGQTKGLTGLQLDIGVV